MENNFEVGAAYHIMDGRLDFTGILVKIYLDGTGLFQSVGTGSNYRVRLDCANKL